MEDLLKKWKASPYYRGELSSFYHVNPKTLLPAFEDEDEVSFIPMEAVDDKDGRIYLQKSTFGQVRKGYTVFKENDLLWAKITPCMQNGKSSVAYGLKNGVGFGSTEFHVLRAKDKNVSIEFLWNILRLDSFLKAAQGAFGGSAGQQRVPATFLSNLPIPLPPLPIQEKLVEEMERARESRRRKLSEADALLSTLDGWLLETLGITPPPEDEKRKTFGVKLKDIQGRVDSPYYQPKFKHIVEALENAKSPLTTIRDICESPVGGATPRKGDQELYTDEGIHFLRILNIKPNQIDLSDVNYIYESVHNGELMRSQLRKDDVLMTITGRVGTAAVVTENILPANINQHIVRLRLKTDEILPEYLATYLNSSIGWTISNRSVTGGTRIALDYEAIRSIPIPKPSIQIQQTIINKLNSIREESRRLKSEAESEWQAAKDWFEAQLLGK